MVAFIKGWRLTVVLIACVPCVVIAGGIMAVVISRMSSRGQIAYAEAGNVVEQTVGAIRTVSHNNHSFLSCLEIYTLVINFPSDIEPGCIFHGGEESNRKV